MNTITIFIIFAPILVTILLIANIAFAPHKPDSEKLTQYESGFSTIPGQPRERFHIAFFLVGILFLVFDLEILLVVPIAGCITAIQSYGFWIFVIFFIILTIGFVYEFASGALYFNKTSSSKLYPYPIIYYLSL